MRNQNLQYHHDILQGIFGCIYIILKISVKLVVLYNAAILLAGYTL
jgi:hypothetical protein